MLSPFMYGGVALLNKYSTMHTESFMWLYQHKKDFYLYRQLSNPNISIDISSIILKHGMYGLSELSERLNGCAYQALFMGGHLNIIQKELGYIDPSVLGKFQTNFELNIKDKY